MGTRLSVPAPWDTTGVSNREAVGSNDATGPLVYTFGRVLGSGTFGTAVMASARSAGGHPQADVPPEVVIKFQRDSADYRNEVRVAEHIVAQRIAATGGTSALAPFDGTAQFYDAFVLDSDTGPGPLPGTTVGGAAGGSPGGFGLWNDVHAPDGTPHSARGDVGVLVLSYADAGDLASLLATRPTAFDDAHTRAFFMLALVHALATLHAYGVQHRDIATHNVAVSTLPRALADTASSTVDALVYAVPVAPGGDDTDGADGADSDTEAGSDGSPPSAAEQLDAEVATDDSERFVGLALRDEEAAARAFLPQLIDFGASSLDGAPTDQAVTRLVSRAPELFYEASDGAVPFDTRSDVWSLGIVLLDVAARGRLVELFRSAPRSLIDAYAPPLGAFCTEQRAARAAGRPYAPAINYLCVDAAADVVRYLFMLVAVLRGTRPPRDVANKFARVFGDVAHELFDVIVDYWRTVGIELRAQRYGVAGAFGADGQQLLERMLAWRVEDRAEADELLAAPYFVANLRTVAAADADAADTAASATIGSAVAARRGSIVVRRRRGKKPRIVMSYGASK